MTFEQYWAIIVKQWKIIVICFVCTGLAAYLVSKIMTPSYQSTALVQVSVRSLSSQADINSLLASDQLVQTEAQLAISDPVLREVAASFPGLTVEQLTREVTSTPKLNTQLFEIDVVDTSPARAANLANAIANTLIRQQQQSTQQNNLQAQQQIQQDLTTTRQQIDTISSQIASLSGQPGKQAQVAILQAQLNGLQQHYSQWQAALAQLELTQAQSSDFLRVVQAAQPPLKPVKPNVALNTSAGLLGGLFLGILLAVLLMRLDTRVRGTEAASQLLGTPVLTTIWRVQPSRKVKAAGQMEQRANNEAYRMLRTSIGFSSIDKPVRSLMVTSALPVEGKSTIAANLAIFMAKAGKSILLIDADLRRPSLHSKFELPPDKKGLSNAVLAFSMPIPISQMPGSNSYPPAAQRSAGAPSLAPFIHGVGIPGLQVMPSGPLPPNPSELLDSRAMQRLMAAMTDYGFDVVIFDTPPLLGLSDASILASKVEGTLVVVDIGRADKKNLKKVQSLLAQAGANVIGCVLNKGRHSPKDTPYSYYYQTDDYVEGPGRTTGNAAPPMPTPMPSKTLLR